MQRFILAASVVTLALLIIALPAIAADAPQLKSSHHEMSPAATLGPQAIPAAVANPNYGLFTCQVGLTPGFKCYDPYQIRHAYNIDTVINAGYTGKGKTIVIVDAFQAPNIASNLNFFNTFYGLPGLNGTGNPTDPNLGTFNQVAPDGLTPFDDTDGNQIGWAVEITLDVLYAHAMAPGANIVLVLAKSNDDSDILSATQYAVNHHLGDVISQSFGENESCMDAGTLAAQHRTFTNATRRHITLVASAGDDGAALRTCDGSSWVRAASSPAVDPLVLSVGGTALDAADYCLTALGCDPTANPAFGTYLGEVVWNEPSDSGSGATGGGYSALFRKPLYQFAFLPFNKRGRGVPDVAYTAAGNFAVLIYLDIPGLDVGYYTISGTSVGAPQWSSIVALADQKAGRGLGFVNGSLYLFSLFPPFYKSMFHDVTAGNNSVTQFDSDDNPVNITGFNAGRGWDATTGLGSPKADQVVNAITFFTSDHDADDAIQSSDPDNDGRSGHHRMRPH